MDNTITAPVIHQEMDQVPPPLPPRPRAQDEIPPPMPPRPQQPPPQEQQQEQQMESPACNPQDCHDCQACQNVLMSGALKEVPPMPDLDQNDTDTTSPIHFARDPHKLIGYLIPFPKPTIPSIPPEQIPQRFLIYTPPLPPFMHAPPKGEKEAKIHKIQRKWLEEVRTAKTSPNIKTRSWKGIKGKATRGISWGMSQTKSSSLEFLNRIGENEDIATAAAKETQHHKSSRPFKRGAQTKKKVKLQEMLLIYPESMPGTNETIRKEFINTILRSKSKAERDAIIATGLLPVTLVLDTLLVVIWPFGGLLEIDAVWLYASVRGVRISRNVTKRLSSSPSTSKDKEDKLHINFSSSAKLDVLERYLATKCHERNPKFFPRYTTAPSESEVLEAIGWFPSSRVEEGEEGEGEREERNWEDEEWEVMQFKEDLRMTMGKGAREWCRWCKLYEEKPEKAVKK